MKKALLLTVFAIITLGGCATKEVNVVAIPQDKEMAPEIRTLA